MLIFIGQTMAATTILNKAERCRDQCCIMISIVRLAWLNCMASH